MKLLRRLIVPFSPILTGIVLTACSAPERSEPSEPDQTVTTESEAESAVYAEGLYQDLCATCHDGGVPEAPTRQALEMLPSRVLIDAMTTGVMAPQSATMSSFDKEILATHLGANADDAERRGREMLMCEGALSFSTSPDWNRWGGDVRNSRYRSAQQTDLNTSNVSQLKLK